jgi:hypothetical protein
MSVKAVGLGLVLLVVSGCSTDTDSVRMARLLMQTVWGEGGEKIPRERAEAVPFASMGIELGSGNQAMLVLGTSSPIQAEWYAGDAVMVRTREGRIVRTAGLPYDLGGLEVRPFPAQQGTLAVIFDFPDLAVFGAPGECVQRDAGPATVEILGVQIATRRIVESCDVPALDWDFESEFWKDPVTNYVWRSRQFIHPRSPPVTLEVFRPEAPAPG